jgi:prevent-host-death family protein
MLKRVTAMKARQNLGEIMNEVNLRNDEYIVERNGKAIAAIVPVWFVLNQQKQAEGFLRVLNKYKDQDTHTDEEAMTLANEAVRAVRKEKRVKTKNVARTFRSVKNRQG